MGANWGWESRGRSKITVRVFVKVIGVKILNITPNTYKKCTSVDRCARRAYMTTSLLD